jgi:hypothetical protein
MHCLNNPGPRSFEARQIHRLVRRALGVCLLVYASVTPFAAIAAGTAPLLVVDAARVSPAPKEW